MGLNTEAVAVQLGDNTVLVAYYNSPQKRVLQNELDALFDLGRKVALAGDFNATHATSAGSPRSHTGLQQSELASFRSILNEVPIVSDSSDIETLDSLLAAVDKTIRKAAEKTIPRTRIHAIDKPDGTAALQNRDIAANLAEGFEQYHNIPNTDPAIEILVEDSLRSFYLKNPIFPETAFQFLIHLQRGDQTAAFSLSLEPIPGKESQLPTSYRPISLLPAISKIFEKILLKHINKHIRDNGILAPEQFVFRRRQSTNHQVAQTEAEKERMTMPGRMAARTAPKTTPDMEKTSTSTSTDATEKTKPPTPAPGTSKKSAREDRRARRRGEAVDVIRLLQEGLPLASIFHDVGR
ncbi:hypothetical protein Trydic_g16448 [Trypoxylus dichotomus]